MVARIGIDAGGSLVKIAYEENRHLHAKSFPVHEIDQLTQWLHLISPDATLYLTGGKSGYLQRLVKQKSFIIEEFKAVTEGTRYLLRKENKLTLEKFILVSIGTGTSIFLVTTNSFERLLGTGIGGGTLMGLGSLITGERDFKQIINLAGQGDHRNSDLLVRDIYTPNEPPLKGDLTAANFGKAHLEENIHVEDHLASLVKMIGETIILLASQAAIAHQVKPIVFTGSTLTSNEPLQTVLSGFSDMLSYEPVFLEKGSHAGAIGALLK
ncbi:type II pantothenate kinase [Ornithinibacillus sp. L9]|uniref:Type II pantothenate kinase n=1 Tax=Ornithinibacillus caprae TaxID=2678566 RepID=A0A6N8FRJ8_9BACI|nr:type II pantothenate kinase [Ornithinibacillus caprae]MUK90428.1 type II pantothenate kinase [Ornithinibacillus caprae]